MTPLAVSLKPYLLYLIFALIFLLSLAIFVGALLIIKRLWKKESVEKSMIEDRVKLASEIHLEIQRLEKLRNRLDPSFVIEGVDISASPISSKLHTPTEEHSESRQSTVGLSEAEVQSRIESATADLMKEIAELTAKLAARSEVAPLEKANSDYEKRIQELEANKKDLEAKLEDYRAFEDELALVRTYKEEIEKLKAQLKNGGAPSEAASDKSLGISEEDIASLFEEMSAAYESDEPSVEVAAKTASMDADEDLLKKDLLKNSVEATSSDSDKEMEDDSKKEPSLGSDDIDSLFIKGDGPEKSEKLMVREKSVQDPLIVPPMTEENAEALVELGDDADELMAEFEKVLGTKSSEKNS